MVFKRIVELIYENIQMEKRRQKKNPTKKRLLEARAYAFTRLKKGRWSLFFRITSSENGVISLQPGNEENQRQILFFHWK